MLRTCMCGVDGPAVAIYSSSANTSIFSDSLIVLYQELQSSIVQLLGILNQYESFKVQTRDCPRCELP
jgi:hypothetical protein